MAAPYTTAEMAAATRRYGYPRGSEFDDGVRVGPTFPGFVSNEVADNTSLSGVPDTQKNCPPLDDCQTVMGYGALLAPLYSYYIVAKGAANYPTITTLANIAAGFTPVGMSNGNGVANLIDGQIVTLDTVTILNKNYNAWVFDWPRTVNIATVNAGDVLASTFNILGVDMYNQPMAETIVATAGNAVASGKKAFKAIIGIYSQGGVNVGSALTLSPSSTTFGLPYYTWTQPFSVNPTLNVANGFTLGTVPFEAQDAFNKDNSDVIYIPVESTGTSGDVRGTVKLANAVTEDSPIAVLAYCPGFDQFLRQQIVNKSSFGSKELVANQKWLTLPAPAWLVSPQTQYGVKQYWGNPAI
jgi:hypothetical protein